MQSERFYIHPTHRRSIPATHPKGSSPPMLFIAKEDAARLAPYNTLVDAHAHGLREPIESPPAQPFQPEPGRQHSPDHAGLETAPIHGHQDRVDLARQQHPQSVGRVGDLRCHLVPGRYQPHGHRRHRTDPAPHCRCRRTGGTYPGPPRQQAPVGFGHWRIGSASGHGAPQRVRFVGHHGLGARSGQGPWRGCGIGPGRHQRARHVRPAACAARRPDFGTRRACRTLRNGRRAAPGRWHPPTFQPRTP